MVVKAASLNDPSWLKPAMHIWTDSAQPWAETSAALPRFAKNPGQRYSPSLFRRGRFVLLPRSVDGETCAYC